MKDKRKLQDLLNALFTATEAAYQAYVDNDNQKQGKVIEKIKELYEDYYKAFYEFNTNEQRRFLKTNKDNIDIIQGRIMIMMGWYEDGKELI